MATKVQPLSITPGSSMTDLSSFLEFDGKSEDDFASLKESLFAKVDTFMQSPDAKTAVATSIASTMEGVDPAHVDVVLTKLDNCTTSSRMTTIRKPPIWLNSQDSYFSEQPGLSLDKSDINFW